MKVTNPPAVELSQTNDWRALHKLPIIPLHHL